MKDILALFVSTQVVLVWGGLADAQPKPPKRAEVPFKVFVTANPEGVTEEEREQIEEARVELAERIADNDDWFQLVRTEAEAEIVVDLFNYWTRQEKRVLTTWGVVPPTEMGQPDKTQMIEIMTYHYLQARVDVFGAARMLRGERIRREVGEAKDAVKDLEKRLEELCREEYYDLVERRAERSRRRL